MPKIKLKYSEPSEQQESFGIRKWDPGLGRWLYYANAWSRKRGHYKVWSASSMKAHTSTSCLSIMFDAQALAKKCDSVIHVVIFKETVVWSVHKSHKSLSIQPNSA